MSTGLWPDLHHSFHSATLFNLSPRTYSRASSKERHRLVLLPKSPPTKCACQRRHYRNSGCRVGQPHSSDSMLCAALSATFPP